MSVHQRTQERRRDRRHERPDREGTGGQSKRPAKLVEERRKEEGEGPGDRYPDAHGHEGKRHDDPAVKERSTTCHAVRNTHSTLPDVGAVLLAEPSARKGADDRTTEWPRRIAAARGMRI